MKAQAEANAQQQEAAAQAKIMEQGFLQKKKIFVHKRHFVKFRCIYLLPLGPVSFNLTKTKFILI